jgi:uncharacterized protein DUF3810
VKTRPVEAVLLVLVAVICAVAPIPPETVERVYSARLYLDIQSVLTTASNQFPIALLDVAVGCLLIAAWMMVRSRVRLVGIRRAFIWNSFTAVKTAAAVYLLFLALWGLNYRRVPLEQKLDYDRSRLTRGAAIAFANTAVAAINAGYAAAHASPPDIHALEASFAEAQGALGATRLAVTGVPKRSLLTFYFRRAAVDGMTDPLFLEIIVNPDVLEFERPFVIAHEWGHLAGYANEAEANFVAWMTCVRGDGPARYSGWLAAYQHAVSALPPPDRPSVKALERGPLEDLRAISARYDRSSRVVRQAARGVYDEYLKANRVAEGIASYDAVVRLMVGTRFDARWTPARR